MSKWMQARMAAVIAVIFALGIGTFWGDDDNFPFGPFRMYSTKQQLDGEIRAIGVHGFTPSGEWVEMRFEDFGLRRADIEGQLGKLAQSPEEVLRAMAVAYDRLDRGDHEIVGLRLIERTYDIEDGVPVAEEVEVLGAWRRT